MNKLGGNRVGNTTPTLVENFTVRDEIAKYFEEAEKCSAEADILLWWKAHEQIFPRLAKLAKLVLGCLATSAVAESAFSVAGCVATARRSKISPFKVSDILFVKDNYDLVTSYLS